MTSTLCHGRSTMMSLEQLAALPLPEKLGRVHKPIHPGMLVTEIKKSFEEVHNLEVVRSEFAMNPKRTRLFGVLDFAPNSDQKALGRTWSMGIISSIDESIRLKLPAGGRVFVCDNLMATGEIVVMRKHTSGFDLQKEIAKMTGKVIEFCKAGDLLIERQERIALPEEKAFEIVGKALVQDFMPASAVRQAGQIYAKGEFPDLQQRSLWGLHNAFTRQVGTLAPASQLPATVEVGKFFTSLIDVLEPVFGRAEA